MNPSEVPPVIDVCCGSRMFWFDKSDSRAIFMDCREESFIMPDKSTPRARTLVIAPDVIADFREIPYPEESFSVVCFDPPHLVSAGAKSWLGRKYGILPTDWELMIAKGFEECFRVLKPNGTLVFKWNETQIPVSKILALTDAKPLFGNRCGKSSKSHWLVFMKEAS